MIFEPSVEKMVEKVGNSYILSNLLGQRAKEIAQEQPDDLVNKKKKEIQIAAEEIIEGKVIVDNISNK